MYATIVILFTDGKIPPGLLTGVKERDSDVLPVTAVEISPQVDNRVTVTLAKQSDRSSSSSYSSTPETTDTGTLQSTVLSLSVTRPYVMRPRESGNRIHGTR